MSYKIFLKDSAHNYKGLHNEKNILFKKINILQEYFLLGSYKKNNIAEICKQIWTLNKATAKKILEIYIKCANNT